MQMTPNTPFALSSTVFVCAEPDFHPFKLLFEDDLVGVVTFGHVTKMAAASFDPP